MKNPGLLLIAYFAFGCATQKYGFRPSGPFATAEAGFPASQYAVPPGAPKGEVYVTSFGTREIDAGGGATSQLIHVRLAVSNQTGESVWSLDPAQQALVAGGAAPQRPDFMEIDGKQDADSSIQRGKRKVFDLYYKMPGGGADAGALPAFELQWQINTGAESVAERTPFAREPYQDYGEANRSYVAVGVAAPWWAYGYGPGYWGGYYRPWGWGYPGYGYGPYVGFGVGYGVGYGGGFRGGHYGGYGGGPRFGGGGGFGRGGGGGGMRVPSVRGRR